MLLYTVNLTKQSVSEGRPWEFVAGEISESIRKNKAARQAWYMNPETEHCFYSGFEGINPRARVSNSNPAEIIRALVGDIDHPYSEEVIRKKIAKLPYPPTWIERSLGGGWHLVWVLDEPARFPQDGGIVEATLDRLAKMLGISDWRGFDEASFLTTSRLYANGGQWTKLENSQSLRATLVNSTIMATVRAEGKKSKTCPVSIERIYELLKEKFPGFEWPGDFEVGSQGPSFWIEGSTSPMSAIVHSDGIYTFSAHRTKDKYYWNDILGPGALERDKGERIQKASKGFYFDGVGYFGPRPGMGGFKNTKPEAIRRMMQTQYGLSSKVPKGEELSEVDQAMSIIETQNSVDGAGPFLFRRAGTFKAHGRLLLNLTDHKAHPPSDTLTPWGPDGGFPFISDWLGRLFVSQEGLDHFLSWLHWFYFHAFHGRPRAGQSIALPGGPGIGKTFLNRRIIGAMVGGAVDATRYLMDKDNFGGQLFENPYWCVDDSGMTTSSFSIRQFTANLKKAVANQSHEFHMKYQKPCDIDWVGRLGLSCNLDANALMIIPSLEDSFADKINLYRLIDNVSEGQILPPRYFPHNVEEIAASEMAAFCRYILEWKIPEKFIGDARYGIVAYHDEQIKRHAYFNSGFSQFIEVINIYMSEYSKCTKKKNFSGTTADLLGNFKANELCRASLMGVNVQTFARQLQNISAAKPRLVSQQINDNDVRIWTINWEGHE